MKEQDMSISADPLFVAAEAQWRRETLAAGFPKSRRGRHHAAGIRSALAALTHGHRGGHGHHGRQEQGRPGTPRVA
jgi:hypothetical protein